MTDTWKQWEGRTVDGRFTLGSYLGGSNHSAVYVTEIAQPEKRKAAIKFVAESPQEDLQLDRWQTAARLSHPNLLSVLASGTCHMDRLDLLYVVMELAEEDLSQILPQRSLTPEETRGMLSPVLEALGYLHGKGLVHTRIKPSNILAIGDQIKLSCDHVCPSKAPRIQPEGKSPYDAPEAAAGTVLPASDIWSLGVTLVETLTQHHPSWRETPKGDLEVTENLSQPFQTIAAHALVREPEKRWNTLDIRSSLTPSLAAAAAAAVPAPATPAPVQRIVSVPAAVQQPAPRATPPRSLPVQRASRRISPLWFVIPALTISGVLVAWIALSRSTPSAPRSSAPASSTETTTASSKPSQISSAAKHDNPTNKVKPSGNSLEAPPPTPAKLAEEAPPTAGLPGGKGQVLDQVLPEVSQKARDTIQGTVRVGVRLRVDASGSVAAAELDSPGPSKYFADLALRAAKRWEFISPEVGGRSAPSEWLVRFDFTSTSTRAHPKQVSP